jgi:hypothetical protein
MGPDKVGEYCAKRLDVAALLVGPTKREDDVQVTTFGWDANRLRLS